VKRRVVEPDEGLAPPAKLLRYLPEEYQEEAKPYTSEGMTRWLLERAAWRASSAVPLPPLPSRERVASWQLELPADLREPHKAAPMPGHWDDRRDRTTR